MEPSGTVRQSFSLDEFFQVFPDEAAAVQYVESLQWPTGAACPKCGSGAVSRVKSGKPMPWRCRDCRKHFSVRTGTVLAESKLGIHKWLLAAYLMTIARKGISSVQLAKELGVTQKTAWFLEHRIREAMAARGSLPRNTVEMDETYLGGKENDKHASQRLHERHPEDKTAVVGIEERGGKARVFPVEGTGRNHLHAAVAENVRRRTSLFTDGNAACKGLPEFKRGWADVRGIVQTNGIESFWSLLKWGYIGIFRYMSAKHPFRCLKECAVRENASRTTMDGIDWPIAGAEGRRLDYRSLAA